MDQDTKKKNLFNQGITEEILKTARPFMEMMKEYECALMEV